MCKRLKHIRVFQGMFICLKNIRTLKKIHTFKNIFMHLEKEIKTEKKK